MNFRFQKSGLVFSIIFIAGSSFVPTKAQSPTIDSLNNKNPQLIAQIKMTRNAGPSGGYGGSRFDFRPPSNARRVRYVTALGEKRVDRICIQWITEGGGLTDMNCTGGNGGNFCGELNLSRGERIVSIEGRYGDEVDRIIIRDSEGRTLVCGGGGGRQDFFYQANGKEAID